MMFKDLGIEEIIKVENKKQYDVNGKLKRSNVYFPDIKDLESLSDIIIKTSRTTVL